jgi:hypothetical protein
MRFNIAEEKESRSINTDGAENAEGKEVQRTG